MELQSTSESSTKMRSSILIEGHCGIDLSSLDLFANLSFINLTSFSNYSPIYSRIIWSNGTSLKFPCEVKGLTFF